MDIIANLTTLLKQNGASLVGFSDITSIPAQNRKDLPYAVTIACALDKDVIKSIQGEPTQIYYDEYNKKNALLDELGSKCAEFLKSNGYKAKALPTTEVGIDCNLKTDFPHKTGAVLSGLGWIGKCALLITKQFGSAVRLTTVFTDLPIGEESRQIKQAVPEKSLCGSCKECIIACPGGALSGKSYVQGDSRPVLYW